MWRSIRATIFGIVVLGAAASGAQAAEELTANTLRLTDGEASQPASISEMAWLAGAWSGPGLGGESEEMWTAPRGGVMMGMYRLIKDDQPSFYELMTVNETNGSLVFRVKHFEPDLHGWEEREEVVEFPFVARRDGRLYFDGLTFEPRGDEVTMYLAIENTKNGAVREEVFRYRRR